MPRRARRLIPGGCYLLINRGNNRSTVFHRPADYAAFMTLIRRAIERIPLEIFAACLMLNHLLAVLRYVERNAVRAGMFRRARDWRCCSAARRRGPANNARVLAEPPVKLPANWEAWVDEPQPPSELEALRTAVNRQRPFGGSEWISTAPECQGYEQVGRPRGRPRRCRPSGVADAVSPSARCSSGRYLRHGEK